jgi:hypothetical protein
MYELDTKLATEADKRNSRITKTGAYSGTVIRAVEIPPNANGTRGIEIEFKAESGETDRLPLYTHKGDGTPLPSLRTVNAIMTCARVRTLTEQPAMLKRWDKDAQKEIDKKVNVFPELAGKPMGLLVEMEESIYQGKTQTRPVLVGAFDPVGRFMASEIIGKQTEPKALDKFVETLRDRTAKKQPGAQTASQPSQSGADDPFGDDIGF